MPEENLLEKIRALGPDERDEVEQFVDALRARAARRDIPASTLEELQKAERAMRWVAEHRREYAGLWVALDGDRLVAAGPSAREVGEAARREGVPAPFLDRVAEEPEGGVWGGWL